MLKIAILAASAAILLGGPAFAADLAAPAAPAVPAAIPAPTTSGVYLELLGGGALAGTLDYTDPTDASDDLPANWAAAGAIGYDLGMGGLSTELDLFYTNRDYDDGDYNLTTASVMANLKYTVDLNDTFGVFGAVGLGGMYLHDHDNPIEGDEDYVNGWGLGYQLQAGISAKVADNVSVLVEYRYENTFSPIVGEDASSDEQSGTQAILAGIKFGF